MKCITEPTIYFVGEQKTNDHEIARFLEDHDVEHWETDTDVAGQKLIEVAGRVCYMSFSKPRPGGNQAYLSHIIDVGHGSVLEHAVFNLLFTGISRTCTHELVRHRAGVGYSQLSQRYVDESTAEYIEPAVIAKNPALHEKWLHAVTTAHETYVALSAALTEQLQREAFRADTKTRLPFGEWLAAMSTEEKTAIRKGARQAARSVLPGATETKIFVTANARAWRHMIEMRCSRHAEPEIRVLYARVLDILAKHSPALFGDYQLVRLPDGTCEAVTENRKV